MSGTHIVQFTVVLDRASNPAQFSKFVAYYFYRMIVIVAAGLMLGSTGYWVSLAYMSLTIVYFLVSISPHSCLYRPTYLGYVLLECDFRLLWKF